MAAVRILAGFLGAVRSLQASRRHSVAVILTLTLATSASLTVWSVWDGVVERPLRFPRAEEIVELVADTPDNSRALPAIYGEELRFLRDRNTSFTALGGWSPGRAALGTPPNARTVRVAKVDPGVLSLLRIPPMLGRIFREQDHRFADAGAPLVVLSYGLWRTVFGGSPRVIGSTAVLDGRLVEIIGVMPRRFIFPGPSYEAWTPAPERRPLSWSGLITLTSTNPIGRLRTGILPEDAATEATALIAEAGLPSVLEREYVSLDAVKLTDRISAPVRPALETLRFGAGLLLLVAAIGSTALRASSSLTEIRHLGIRLAVGATWRDELLRALARTLLLSAVVGLASAGIAAALYRLCRSVLQDFGVVNTWEFPWVAMGGGFPVALLTVGCAECLAFVTSFCVGTRRQLGQDAMVVQRRGLALVLVGTATGASAVLLLSTTVMAGGAWRVVQGTGAYAAQNLVHLTLDAGGGGGSDFGSPSAEFDLDELAHRLGNLHGVKAVGYADHLPDRLGGSRISGASVDGNANSRLALRLVSPSFLPALGVPVTRGRGIQDRDAPPGEVVAVADESLARRYRGRDPIGQLIATDTEQFRIVGVVPDIEVFSASETRGSLYAHFAQPPHDYRPTQAEVVVRWETPPSEDQIAMIRRMTDESDGALRLLRIESGSQRRAGFVGSGILTTIAVAVFALAGVLLSFVGMLGQLANEVARKSHALAVRVALGAPRRSVAWEAFREVALAALVGILLGMAGSWLLGRLFLEPRMPWVGPGELEMYAGTAVVLVGTVAFACAVGALFAGRGDPWRALRAG